MYLLNAWLLIFQALYKKQEYKYLKPGVIHYHVRREIAKKVFESSYDKLGRFIQVTNEQYEVLINLRDDELVTKIKEILNDAVD